MAQWAYCEVWYEQIGKKVYVTLNLQRPSQPPLLSRIRAELVRAA